MPTAAHNCSYVAPLGLNSTRRSAGILCRNSSNQFLYAASSQNTTAVPEPLFALGFQFGTCLRRLTISQYSSSSKLACSVIGGPPASRTLARRPPLTASKSRRNTPQGMNTNDANVKKLYMYVPLNSCKNAQNE